MGKTNWQREINYIVLPAMLPIRKYPIFSNLIRTLFTVSEG